MSQESNLYDAPGLFNASVIPTPTNRARWLVMVDVMPDVGPQAGFFQLEATRRTINGFTTNRVLDVIGFLKSFGKAFQGDSEGRIDRQAVIVIDRLTGSLITYRDMQWLAAEAFGEEIALRRNSSNTGEARARTEAMLAKRILAQIPAVIRPKKTFLRGETPLVILRANGLQNFVLTGTGSERVHYDVELRQAIADYNADRLIPASYKANLPRALPAITNALPAAITQHRKTLLTQNVVLLNRGGSVNEDAGARMAAVSNLIDMGLQRMFAGLIDSPGGIGLTIRPGNSIFQTAIVTDGKRSDSVGRVVSINLPLASEYDLYAALRLILLRQRPAVDFGNPMSVVAGLRTVLEREAPLEDIRGGMSAAGRISISDYALDSRRLAVDIIRRADTQGAVPVVAPTSIGGETTPMNQIG